ncbi:hypothetical protein QYH69_34105 [Paraburkholderia sp. SARCC-3016]|uniref:hypothetical protein n=1 Tax=Paraburkholderia sp. SARCC-3016 TaxID=3058611 RepID=UPI0028099A08|nr:hypothetical protein [Paraburkholderia sp. SARCC-3016]MDQ7982260.1 hypothetical protein [Paraburkholderia sp. SARCC-3016]
MDHAAVIESMCLTWRHDFGVDRVTSEQIVGAGMTDEERDFLRREMGQLFEHHIAPAVRQAVEAEREACLAIVESHGKDHAKVRLIAGDIRARNDASDNRAG